MSARLTPTERMARIRKTDTRPELLVRRAVHGLGYRFRLHRRDLPTGGLAQTIVDKMMGTFDPAAFEDRYEQAMIDLIRSKEAGLPPPQAPPANVVNLFEALRRSIEAQGGKAEAPAKPLHPSAAVRRAAVRTAKLRSPDRTRSHKAATGLQP